VHSVVVFDEELVVVSAFQTSSLIEELATEACKLDLVPDLLLDLVLDPVPDIVSDRGTRDEGR